MTLTIDLNISTAHVLPTRKNLATFSQVSATLQRLSIIHNAIGVGALARELYASILSGRSTKLLIISINWDL